ncbi:methyl-accepting chemotaxis protein [uncultured Tateyamaria sp.]|uniref:methyl-accepting chemotaxis protein n=1 Tax=uncultured Tateyamaria sp. TaxID=455651 RepID=UPI002606AC50|nr:methyl-accepting chemotaxis protein [uncultured Tateyamaria sp.]
MLDTERNSDQGATKAPLSRLLQLQCRALAAVPHEFRAVGTWLNYNCALLTQLDDVEHRERVLADMNDARTALDKVMLYFDLNSDIPDVHPQALEWFRSCLQRAPQKSEPFRKTANMLSHVQDVVLNDPAAAKNIHRDTSHYIITQLAPEIVALLDILNAEVEQQEQDRVHYAEQLRSKADAAVSDIKSISKMVRLISLNASVEAARAGDAGRAFGVIASEVKAMSEAIQTSANTVTGTVRDLSDRL